MPSTARIKTSLIGRVNPVKGFTLIELLLVTILMGIILVMTVPNFKNAFSGLATKEASMTMIQIMRYAQERATIERKNQNVRFDFQEGAYRLLELDDTEDPAVYKIISGKTGKSIRVPRGVTLSGSREEFVFYPDGRCDDGNISVKDTKGQGYNIFVSGLGSKIEMKNE